MPTVGYIEDKIRRVEGFEAHFMRDGRNVNSNMEDLPGYPYERAAPNAWTVAQWKEQRFKAHFPGFDVKVLNAMGEEVRGPFILETVRNGYSR